MTDTPAPSAHPGRGGGPNLNPTERENTMNTPIFNRLQVDHFLAAAFQMPPVYEPPPRPTRAEAEVIVAGIEGMAFVRARLGRLVQR